MRSKNDQTNFHAIDFAQPLAKQEKTLTGRCFDLGKQRDRVLSRAGSSQCGMRVHSSRFRYSKRKRRKRRLLLHFLQSATMMHRLAIDVHKSHRDQTREDSQCIPRFWEKHATRTHRKYL